MAFRVKFKMNKDKGSILITGTQDPKEAYDTACVQLRKNYNNADEQTLIVYKPKHYGR